MIEGDSEKEVIITMRRYFKARKLADARLPSVRIARIITALNRPVDQATQRDVAILSKMISRARITMPSKATWMLAVELMKEDDRRAQAK